MAKLQYVRQGQPFRPSADDWNAIVDAARLRGGPVRTGGELLSIANPDPNWITVRNDDAVEMPRWGCCVLGGPVIEPGAPGDGLEGFLAQLAFTSTRPVETDLPRRARLAILLEPLQPGAFGRAAIAGLVRVKLTVNSLVHTRATVVPGTDYLQTTAGEGQCTVIWTEASTGAGKWGIVQVGLLVVPEQIHVRVLDGAAAIAGETNRWWYPFEEVALASDGHSWDVVTGGELGDAVPSSGALNGAEAGNDGTGREVVGRDVEPSGSTITLRPIGYGGSEPVLPAHRVSYVDGDDELRTRWVFSIPNDEDAGCA